MLSTSMKKYLYFVWKSTTKRNQNFILIDSKIWKVLNLIERLEHHTTNFYCKMQPAKLLRLIRLQKHTFPHNKVEKDKLKTIINHSSIFISWFSLHPSLYKLNLFGCIYMGVSLQSSETNNIVTFPWINIDKIAILIKL